MRRFILRNSGGWSNETYSIGKPWCGLAALAFVAAWSSGAAAQGDHDFKGKTIRLIIGTSTGGGVDLYARLVAQFLGKHLPGEPTIIPQNMPGASSVVAANFVYNMAKPDGLDPGRFARGCLL